MIPFHAFFSELARRDVRCLRIGPTPTLNKSALPDDDYLYLENYCEDPACDCRRVFLQVIRRNQTNKVLANIVYGWEKESFYRKGLLWDENPEAAARRVVRGELDPLNEQSEFAEQLLALFRQYVLDEPYRFRLRRHYQLFKEELARREAKTEGGSAK